MLYSVLRSVNLLSVTRFLRNIRGGGKDMKVKENNKAWIGLSIVCLNYKSMVDQEGSVRYRSKSGTCSGIRNLMPS